MHQYFRGTLCTIALILIVAYTGFAQIIAVEIGNVPPEVLSVDADSVTLSNDATTTVTCTSIASDDNGYNDLILFEGSLWHSNLSTEYASDDNQTHYSSKTYDELVISATEKNVTVTFPMHSNSKPGEWYCKVRAYDNTTSAEDYTNLTVFSTGCSNSIKDGQELLTDCGGPDCQECLQGTDVTSDVFPGQTITIPLIIYSTTPESINIVDILQTELKDNGYSIIRSKVTILPQNSTLDQEHGMNFSITIDVPFNITPATFISNITIVTSTNMSLNLQLLLNILTPSTAPTIGSVNVTYPIVLDNNANTDVICNAQVIDINGIDKISSLNATFQKIGEIAATSSNTDKEIAQSYAISDETTYIATTSSFNISSNISEIVTFQFQLEPSTDSGLYRCQITAIDDAGLVGSNHSDSIVYDQSCNNDILNSKETLIDCGGGCPACLSGSDITIDAKSGKRTYVESSFYSYAPGTLNITGFDIENMTSDFGVIDAEHIGVTPNSILIDNEETVQFMIFFSIPEGLEKGYYKGGITALTNTSITASVDTSVNIRSRGSDYINLLTDYTCINNPIYIKTLDEDTGKPVDDVLISIYYGDGEYGSQTTDDAGDGEFILKYMGSYNITASKSGYNTEETSIHIAGCTENQLCFDGIKNQGEFGIDCGGSCPSVCETCFNGILDEAEIEVDCGGGCAPCTCQDGIKNDFETGIDCGGACPSCPDIPYIPHLVVSTKEYVTKGSMLEINVKDEANNPVAVLIKITDTMGDITTVRTDSSGQYFILVKEKDDISEKTTFSDSFDMLGVWNITAYKAGYMPGTTSVTILNPVGAIVSSVFLIIIFIIAIWSLFKLTSKTIADYNSIQYLMHEDRIQKHKRLYITEETFDKLSESIQEHKIKKIHLNLEDVEEAEKLSAENDIDVDLSKLIVAAKKLKARTILLTSEPSSELKNKFHKIKFKVLD